MKRNYLLSGILAILLIFSIVVICCDDEKNNNGKIDGESELEDDGDTETEIGNGSDSDHQSIKIIDAQVLQFIMSEQVYIPYSGSVSEIISNGANVSGSIINGILNLTIGAPLQEHYSIFQNDELYSMFSIDPPELEFFIMLPYGIHEIFPVVEDITGNKMMLGRFRDNMIGNGAHWLIYSKGDGIITVKTEGDASDISINVKNGWNYFEIYTDKPPQNIEKPGDNYKWYIWEGKDNSAQD